MQRDPEIKTQETSATTFPIPSVKKRTTKRFDMLGKLLVFAGFRNRSPWHPPHHTEIHRLYLHKRLSQLRSPLVCRNFCTQLYTITLASSIGGNC
jgi:hypothetical protein